MHGKVIGISAAVPALVASLALLSDGSKESQPIAAADIADVSDTRLTRVRLSTGIELQVAERGLPDGEPVIFLHGYTDSWFSYSSTLEHVPSTIRAIVPTQRGHGDSAKPECCYRITDFAADAVALLDALGIERATVVGHSMGSFVAQRVAIDHPDRVHRLVLIGSGRTIRTQPVLEFNEIAQALPDTVDLAFVREFQESTVFQSPQPAFMDGVIAESSKLPGRLWRDVLASVLSSDAASELHRIQAPTLIVWGEQEALFMREDQDAMLRAIPAARLLVYPDAAHSPQWEHPARFATDLQAFLSAPAAAVPRSEPRGHEAHTHALQGGPGPMRLLAGLGDWQHAVSTSSPQAQRYFDQGLRLTYAFNHDEAARSFEQAVQLDSLCALCHWGVAYAVGPNINLPMEADVEPRAVAAVGRASTLRDRTTALERALIDALALRYGEPAGVSRAERDSAYAAEMREVARRFPENVDAQVLFADAMLNLSPWNQWARDGSARPGTDELIGALERALEHEPNHAGACHFYIHAIEASATPELALPCAERLPGLMPGAGHVVHMPAHVYLRVGRYEDAARANIAAVEADHRYFAEHDVTPGIYPLFYAPHNLHFLWATYVLSGQRAKALQAARSLTDRVALADAREAAALEGFLPSPVLTLARFRDWDGVFAEARPRDDLRYAKGMWHYARGLALAARADARRARVQLDSVRSIAGEVGDDMIIILNPAPLLLKLAAEVLAGEIEAGQKNFDAAARHLRTAVRLEDALTYDEPPPWYHSARNLLGEALLAAGRAAEAEAAFREDLWFVRENGWSLSGLERALRAQRKNSEAADVARRFRQAWQYADTPAHARRE